MLGEFHMDGFKHHANAALLYVFFISTTFVSQITFLNMLIAIMGDTFDRVIDQRPTYSLKNKLMLMAAMKSMIRSRRLEDESKVFIYVIQPANRNEDEMNEDENGWRGKLFYIQSFIRTKFERSNEIITSALTDLRAMMDKNISQVKEGQGSMQRRVEDKIDQLLKKMATDAPQTKSNASQVIKRVDPLVQVDPNMANQQNTNTLNNNMEQMLKSVQSQINEKFASQQKQ